MEKKIIDVNFVNLCIHDINIYALDGKTLLCTVKPQGVVARAQVTITETDHEYRVLNCGNVIVSDLELTYGKPENLPEPKDGDILLVSAATANAAKTHGRSIADIKVPGQGIRDPHGVIIGCKGVNSISSF